MSFEAKFLTDFVSKLNHPLDEVRFRALKNISNKVERCIITIEDLCKHKEFIPYLLEWFNHDVVKYHDSVLKLVEMASEFDGGGKQIIKIGGIEFLTQLKLYSNTSNFQILDQIIKNLLKVNSNDTILSENEGFSCSLVPKVNKLTKNKIDSEEKHFQQAIGYFNSPLSKNRNENSNFMKEIADIEQENLLKLSVHPIIPLTVADKNVLSGSLGTLRSDDFRVVISGIQFFTDVILEDFPSPVFLQRQGVLKLLLRFISEKQYSTIAVKAISKLCYKMLQYINTCLDPNFFSTKNTFGIINQNYGEYEEDNHWNSDDLLGFHYEPNFGLPEPLPVPVFCLQVINVCLYHILEIDTDSNWAELFHLICTAIELFRESFGSDLRQPYLLELWNLKDQINDVLTLWSRLLKQCSIIEDMNYRKLSNKRQIYLCLFAIFWNFISSIFSPEMALKYLQEHTKTELCRAQFDKCLLLGLGENSVKLITYIELFDQNFAKLNKESNRLMQSSESLIKFFLNNNEPIKYAEQCISAAENSLDCLEYVYGVRFCKEFAHFFSLISSTEIFGNREDMFIKCDEILQELMKSTNHSICKSIFTEIFDIVQNSLTIEEAAKPKSNSENKINFLLRNNIFKNLILFGLYNELKEIHETATALFCKLWEGQRIMSVIIWRQVMNITWKHMIYLQPLCDLNTRVGRQILQLLLSNSSNIDNFLDDKISNQRNFQNNIIKFLPLFYNKNYDVRKEACQYLEQFLRFDRLWNCQLNIQNMTDFLVSSVNDNKHERWFPRLLNGQSKSLDNYYLGDIHKLHQQNSGKGFVEVLQMLTWVKIDNFKKIFDIYLSSNIDISVRKSAAEQLEIFLQMGNMHNYFISNGGLHYVLELLKGKILDKSHLSILVPSTILILLRIVQHTNEIRKNLYDDSLLIDNLIQMALYFCYDKQCVADISSILFLVIFNSVLKQDNLSAEIKILEIIGDRILLPFRVGKYSANKTSKTEWTFSNFSKIPNQKWNYQESFERNLRIHWTLLKHGGLNNYLRYKYSFYGKKIIDSDDNYDLIDEILPCVQKLTLTESDLYVLNNSIPQFILCDNLHQIDNAINHCQVQSSLISIELVLILRNHAFLNVDIYDIFNETSLWISTFQKFLLNIPSCSADFILLEFIMDVLENIIKLSMTNHMKDFIQWLVQIMTTPNNSLFYFLEKGDKLIGKTDSRRLTLAKNKIESRLPNFFLLLMRYLNLNNIQLSSKQSNTRSDIIKIHKMVFDICLNQLTQYLNYPFDNLSKLLIHIHLMSRSLEVKSNFFQGNTLKVISNVINLCGDLILKFHTGREESSITFMGSGVVYYLLRILIELICNHLDFEVDRLIETTVCQTDWLRKSPWLVELIGYRSVDIRAMSATIISKMIQYEQSRSILFRHCSEILPESLWSVALTLYLDISEAPIVRSEAISILQNLLGKLPFPNSMEIPIDVNQNDENEDISSLFIDRNSSGKYQEINGFYQKLLYLDFFRKAGLSLTNFYTLPFINCSYFKHKPLYDPEYQINFDSDFQKSVNINQILSQMRTACEINISTPLMISALVSFLCNLYYYLPDQVSSQFNELRINTLIMNMFDPHTLKVYMESFQTEHYSTTVDLVLAFTNCVKLIRLQINMNSSLKDSFLIDEKFIETIIQLLIVTKPTSDFDESHDNRLMKLDLYKYISQLRVEILYLLISLVIPTPIKNHVQLMLAHVASHVTGIFNCIKEMIEIESRKSGNVALCFVSVFLCLSSSESKFNSLIRSLESQRFSNSERVIIEDFTELLLKKRESLSRINAKSHSYTDTSINERINVHNTLKILLGTSQVVKNYLVRVGFIESTSVEIKYLHSKLDSCAQNNVDVCIRQNKGSVVNENKISSWKQIIKEIISVLELLQNFFYEDVNAQSVAVSMGFQIIVYRLWTVALLDSGLLHCILNCLINLSADTINTAKAIVICHQVHQQSGQPPSQGSSISLIENICRLTSADLTAYYLRENTVKLIFLLLSNLVWCPEGINILLRIRFLDKFEQINPNQLQKSASGIAIQNLWLGLIISLSFTEEGQNAIMKSNGSGIMKVLNVQNNILVLRLSTLLIIRNMCTHPVIKVKLMVNGSSLIENIKHCLDSNHICIKQLSLSTLKALLYSNNKIRVYLKSANLVTKLMSLREIYENDSKNGLLLDIISLLNAFQDPKEFRTQ